MKYRIPFNKPFIVGKELYYIAQSVLSGRIAGDGLFTKKCQALMEERFGAKKILLTHSCTAALEIAAILCEVGPGDEVVLSSFTFVSTANAFYLRGATLVFGDIRPDTLNIDETKIEDAITEHTKVIVPVQYVPLHLSPVGVSMGYKKGQFPETESMSRRLLRLPLYYDLKPEEQAEVVNTIKYFFR